MSRSLIYSTISAASAALLLVLSLLIAHALGQAGWGNFSYALSLAMIGEALMDFGIHQVTIRSIARDPADASRLFRNSLALKAVPGLVMFVALTAVAFLIKPDPPDPTVPWACMLMIASAVCRSYLLTVRGVLQGLERFGQDSVVVVGDRLLLLAAGAIALRMGAHLVGLAVSFVVARLIAVAGALVLAHRHVGAPRPQYDPAVWRELRQRALPLGAFLVMLNLYSDIDTIILRALTSAVETGLYNSAYRIYEGLAYVPAIISAVLTPRLSHLWANARKEHLPLVRRGLGAAAGLALGAAAGTWVAAPFVLRIFPDAEVATLTLRILASGLVSVFVIWMLHAVAISIFAERLLLKTTIAGTVANVALNAALIPRYGRDGAAAATVGGELFTMLVLLWGLRHALGRESTQL